MTTELETQVETQLEEYELTEEDEQAYIEWLEQLEREHLIYEEYYHCCGSW